MLNEGVEQPETEIDLANERFVMEKRGSPKSSQQREILASRLERSAKVNRRRAACQRWPSPETKDSPIDRGDQLDRKKQGNSEYTQSQLQHNV